jgi:anti-sigma B factor antagonist
MSRDSDRRASHQLLHLTHTPWGDDLLVVTADGEIDMLTAPALRTALSRPLPARTVIDLRRVTFLGVAGVHVLEQAADEADIEGRVVGVTTPAHGASRILRHVGFDLRVPVFAELSDAIRDLSATAPDDRRRTA